VWDDGTGMADQDWVRFRSMVDACRDAMTVGGTAELSVLHDWLEEHGYDTRREEVAVLLKTLPPLHAKDWQEAFGFAGYRAEGVSNNSLPERALPRDAGVSLAPFGPVDVAQILALSEGENDGEEWLLAGRLHDGRWFSLAAWCDNTGWD
jgi:hypothetical protein